MLTQIYHEIWLQAHPERTEDWLKARLSDGFHIHHVDGDHNNNDPKNLILVDGVDHLRLHGMSLKDGIIWWRSNRQKRAKEATDKPRGRPRKIMAATPPKPDKSKPKYQYTPLDMDAPADHEGAKLFVQNNPHLTRAQMIKSLREGFNLTRPEAFKVL